MICTGRVLLRHVLVLLLALSIALPVALIQSSATAVNKPSTSNTTKSVIYKKKTNSKKSSKGKTKIPTIRWQPAKFIPSLQTVLKSGPPLSRIGCHGSPTVATAKPCLFGDVNQPRVLLFGDSHAAHWYGPINKVQQTTNKFSLNSLTKAACSAIDSKKTFVPVGPPIPGEVVQPDKATNCRMWRKDALRKIANQEFGRLKLVILSPLVPREGTSKKKFQEWKRGYLRTLKVVSPGARRVVILRDMPLMPKSSNIVSCLSKYKTKSPEKCGAPAKQALNPTAWKITKQVAKRFKNVKVVDLASSTCKRGFCSPVRGRYIKVRDSHHYTHPYMTRFMIEPLRKVLRKVI